MPNPNYVKGRRKEYSICKSLKEEGFDIVVRSAGSHSQVDIWAVRREPKQILLIQAKPDTMLKTQKNAIELHNHWLKGDFNVKFEVR